VSSKRIGTIAAGIIAASVVLASSEGAKALECPTPHPNHSDLALPQTQTEIRSYSKLIAAQGGRAIPTILYGLKSPYPHATDAALTNFMIGLFCPLIKNNAALSEEQKRRALKVIAKKIYARIAE
jgi:hypothetical protein